MSFEGLLIAAAVVAAKPIHTDSLAANCAVLIQVEMKLKRQAGLEASLSNDIRSYVPVIADGPDSTDYESHSSRLHREAASNLNGYGEVLALMAGELDEQVELLKSLEVKCPP